VQAVTGEDPELTEPKVLGPIEVAGTDGAVKVGGPTQRRLLAALIADANTVIPTERLMDVMWDGDLPPGRIFARDRP
jgi:DNA-binding SARP family transcriptional activator